MLAPPSLQSNAKLYEPGSLIGILFVALLFELFCQLGSFGDFIARERRKPTQLHGVDGFAKRVKVARAPRCFQCPCMHFEMKQKREVEKSDVTRDKHDLQTYKSF